MLVRHGSPLIILGAFLAIAVGALAFVLTQSLRWSLGGATAVLAAFAIAANRARFASGALVVPSAKDPPLRPARSAVGYVTAGALLAVWSATWYCYFCAHPPERDIVYYTCYGSFLTGLVLLVIGLLLGRIGRAARRSELPPQEVTRAAVGSRPGEGTWA